MTTRARKGTTTSHAATCRSPERKDQGAYRARGHEQVERRHAEHQPAERDDDVGADGDGGRRSRRDTAPRGDCAERGRADLVARERVQQPCSPHYAGQCAAEGADRGADGDELTDPPGDELAAEIAEKRARGDKVLDALLVCSEAHHLDGGDEDIVQAPEDGDAKDRTRYVATGLLRLLAERRGSLEPGEGEKPEHHAEKQR